VTASFPLVWVEEGSRHEAEETAREAEASRPPVGTATGSAAPLEAPRPASAQPDGPANGSIRRLRSVLSRHQVKAEPPSESQSDQQSNHEPAIPA